MHPAICALVVPNVPAPPATRRRRSPPNCIPGWPRWLVRAPNPEGVRFGDSLPKARSGKIKLRLLHCFAIGESTTKGTPTLGNPATPEPLTPLGGAAASSGRAQRVRSRTHCQAVGFYYSLDAQRFRQMDSGTATPASP